MRTWYVVRQLENGDTVSASLSGSDIGIVLAVVAQEFPLTEIIAIGLAK